MSISCTITPQRPVAVRENLTFRASHTPASAAVSYVFDHGDGTLDPGAVSDAYYLAPGSYNVQLRWTYRNQTGTIFCGTVTVVPGTNPTPTPAPIQISCSITPQRPVVVREILTYRASHTPANAAVSYVFDHGDGTLDPGPVSEAFYVAPGTYTVKLRWTYRNQTGTIFCGTVTVVPGTNPTPTPAPIQISCSITPQRPVVVREILTYRASHTPANAAVSYVFDHGDGTLDPGPVSEAFYVSPGTYTVKLRWTYRNQTGTIFCGTVTVIPGPVPTPTPVQISCSITPQRPVVVREVLTYRASHTPASVPVSYVFDHGDGTLDNGPVSNAYYVAPGTYTVKLRWAHSGTSGTIVCGTVTVTAGPNPTPTPAPLSIGCSITPQRPVLVNETLTFTALQSPANLPVSYVFDHGDGTLDPRPVSTAFYAAPGTYTVRLRWSYNNQSGTIFCGTVTVNPR